MSDTITPALTPEEWSKLWAPRSPLDVTIYDGALEITRDGPDGESFVRIFDGDRQVVAALALHGQPFGFTREDVDLLRLMVQEARGFNLTGYHCRRLTDFADRIEALLPPE